MSLETNKEIAVLSLFDDLHRLLKDNPDLTERVKAKLDRIPIGPELDSLLASKRNRRAKQPYYSERFALELASELDKMIITHEPCQFLISEHTHLTTRTLYLKIYQPWTWLRDFHPEKEKYQNLWEKTTIFQKKNHSVRIVFTDDVKTLKSQALDLSKDNILALTNRITEFLTAPIANDIIFDEKKLSLTEAQINDIKDSLAGISNITIVIEPTRVRILRKFVTL